ncbi:TsaC protein (YrdC domain) required for threonylcarbamoyladenosine t(6)A37 modification in tRNA [Acidisarcina polymorpha]|uniref:TsaC protein (YrdC domain) required for threonylcarbamoyladenosine t(6)A37 modification in tRNA n=1 Tax=Acidisarcina polymorpha TaxID=2211140 RepID=A0A2Z5FZN5_9BACT|nr:glycosyl hydrolase family protein [Acidisarcina polymorpha]AXC11865.1 TsaC protein (YrdC domain) required for threonylcarbamoyladenosine t(6)A37 modification in tRNA [Acidisarcina polymorpha]
MIARTSQLAIVLKSTFLAMALFAIAFCGPAASRAYAGTKSVSVTIQQGATQMSIDSTFNGFSWDKNTMTGPLFSPDDDALVALFRQLGPGVLRSGGNSGDQVVWDPNGRGMTHMVMSPPDIERLAAFLNKTNWKVIYGLNFAIGNPPLKNLPSEGAVAAAAATAANEAATAASILGDRLIGFEIGNEPGDFSNNGLRPSNYSFAEFKTEWQTFANAIRTEVPNAVFVGPADLTYTPPFITNLGKQAGLITQHYYRSSGEAGNSTDIQQLLTIDPYLVNTILPTTRSLSAAVPVRFRMGECNAFSQPIGMGNIFAVALWAIDFEFLNAMNNSAGVNFQPVPGIAPLDTRDGKGVVTGVNPLFYAMKLFSMAADGTLLKTSVSAQQGVFSAYAVSGNNGSTYVVLSNKDSANAVEASINFMQPMASATSTVLTAPSLTSTSGTTLGGSPINPDGSWSPTKIEPVAVSNRTATVTIPAGSAAFIEALPATTSLGVPKSSLCVQSTQNTSDGSYVLQQAGCNSTSPGQAFAFVPTQDGFYYVLPQNSNLCLDWQQPSVLQTACARTHTQKWQIESNTNGTYSLLSRDGHYCLNVSGGLAEDGKPMTAGSCTGQSSSQLNLSNPPDAPLQTSSTSIILGYDNLCMDIKEQSLSVGPYVQQHACNGKSNQSFALASTPDGHYTISSNESLLCLDGSAGNTTVIQNVCTGGNAQEWQLNSKPGGTYTLQNAASQGCLGIPNGSNSAGSLFALGACNAGANQMLKLATPPSP